MRLFLHRFLLWMWPAIFAGVVAVVGAAAAVAQGFPETRTWIAARFNELLAGLSLLSGPEILALAVILSLMWLGAFVWSGRNLAVTTAESAVVLHRIEPDPVGDLFRRVANRPPASPRRDTGLLEAAIFYRTGRFDAPAAEAFPLHLNRLRFVALALEQAAIDEKITIWGKRGHRLPNGDPAHFDKIPPGHWQAFGINVAMLGKGLPVSDQRNPTAVGGGSYVELMTSRSEIIRERRHARF